MLLGLQAEAGLKCSLSGTWKRSKRRSWLYYASRNESFAELMVLKQDMVVVEMSQYKDRHAHSNDLLTFSLKRSGNGQMHDDNGNGNGPTNGVDPGGDGRGDDAESIVSPVYRRPKDDVSASPNSKTKKEMIQEAEDQEREARLQTKLTSK